MSCSAESASRLRPRAGVVFPWQPAPSHAAANTLERTAASFAEQSVGLETVAEGPGDGPRGLDDWSVAELEHEAAREPRRAKRKRKTKEDGVGARMVAELETLSADRGERVALLMSLVATTGLQMTFAGRTRLCVRGG